ncbi:BON domain-containing protein [Methylocella sp.]|uniref:BON domain-containing protein n=1 Tax=Methylocella sp. TaxID=1978226 RepID=UPI0037849785
MRGDRLTFVRNSQREGFGSDRLGGDPYANAEDIEVTVASGEISLTGAADDREQRRRAEIVAQRVAGVSHVQNNLRVKDRRVGRHEPATQQGAAAQSGSSTGRQAQQDRA